MRGSDAEGVILEVENLFLPPSPGTERRGPLNVRTDRTGKHGSGGCGLTRRRLRQEVCVRVYGDRTLWAHRHRPACPSVASAAAVYTPLLFRRSVNVAECCV